MKIAVPVINDSDNPEIAQQLGRAPFYMVYDTEAKTSEKIVNPAQDSPSGAGVKAAQTIVNTGSAVLLTIRCGDKAYEVLNGAGVKVMEAFVGSAMDNINAYEEGKMSELETIHSGHHGKGA
ncbi:MAG: NifB/NifX family molybdenum-iron cluster-binding protein [Candidatus Methanomethylophilaceae archaeon]|jgi:predicted Fe-Mo cluster-binding NifX family protein